MQDHQPTEAPSPQRPDPLTELYAVAIEELASQVPIFALPKDPKHRRLCVEEMASWFRLASRHESVFLSHRNRKLVGKRNGRVVWMNPPALAKSQSRLLFDISKHQRGLKTTTIQIDYVLRQRIEGIVNRLAKEGAVKPGPLAPGKVSPRTGRRSNHAQTLKRATREAVYAGHFDNDMSKAHLAVMVCETGTPIASQLYESADTEYPRLAALAGCTVPLVKRFVNQAIIASIPKAMKGDSWMQEALDSGLSWTDARKALVTLQSHLMTWLVEVYGYHRKLYPNLSGKALVSEVACYLMRRESAFIQACERECAARGINTVNLHDGFYSDKPVPNEVFDAARQETGLSKVKMKTRQL